MCAIKMRDNPSRQLTIKRYIVIDKGDVVGKNPKINYMQIIRKFRKGQIFRTSD